jgi:hypothetical protein
VIGKANRLRLPPRETSTRTPHPLRKRLLSIEGRNTRPNASHPKLTATQVLWAMKKDGLPLPKPGEADIPRVSFLDLEHYHCRFPCWHDDPPMVGEPAFCGARRVPNTSYCAIHLVRTAAATNPSRPQLHVVAEKETVAT